MSSTTIRGCKQVPWVHRVLLASALLLCAGGCAADQTDPAGQDCVARTAEAATPAPSAGDLEPSEPFGLTTAVLRSPDGDSVELTVYDAYEPAARTRGLMGRRHLPADAGMVFRFPEDRTGSFWMCNTLIPLSIAFFDDQGTVLATLDMAPCEAMPCPAYSPGLAYRGALEVNQGRFEAMGLRPGWSVELPAGLPPAR